MIRFLVTVVLLTIVYVLTLAHFDPWDFALGAVLASGVYLMFQSWVFPIGDTTTRQPAPPLWRRIIAAPIYAAMVVINITKWALLVSLYVLRIRPVERQGVIGLPYGERSEVGVVVSAYADTLTPGSVIVDFDEERRISWTHVIDATDPDGFRDETDELYDRYQRHVIP
ncbi:MAG: Na+/H+ antiporter subunit E [Thermomicrobiales bacterium]|nr:Na+/H+ antiporter subunit E [Thermomicrobiales bacterium]